DKGPPTKNKRLDWWRRIDIGISEPQVLEPGLLADQRTTRTYLMQSCLAARRLVGREPLPMPYAALDPASDEQEGSAVRRMRLDSLEFPFGKEQVCQRVSLRAIMELAHDPILAFLQQTLRTRFHRRSFGSRGPGEDQSIIHKNLHRGVRSQKKLAILI